ncbi:putative transmembrane protein [Toxoplasma gondii RUB]|uniref:Transmembrane protein n=11 Tax=Toxoplasma gondii TaxID=5811 RepID=S7V1H1_TOXGG|nr:hypothetical protein TGGT1_217400 [Toxoplasma gondii GT1]KAF4638322.1 hypothetical protein TGRH88_059290 [Toxoplasma gondii]KFG37786.1 putative transmembrane protein [Toxoplasma gondii p89]KFG47343.1 putative transmembrane protein [Toxoplasma gondii GAB2-2007-GAL-DOM2]KFG50644.1 putative transmembrane protein [Toxoplasma gondii FOU]KFG64746.1 putative transmembrane protein [Toxoplasma gondii RUB]KFH05317.1 putative transmembrane protein [Toxoplasma gondii VAND]KFH15854.1 putative transmem
MAACGRLAPLVLLFLVAYFPLLCSFARPVDSEDGVDSDNQTLTNTDFELENDSMENQTSDDAFDDITEQRLDNDVENASFAQLATQKSNAAAGQKLFAALENAMKDQNAARTQQQKGQDMFFAAKKAVDTGDDSALQCVIFKPKRKWSQLLKSFCKSYRKQEQLFSTCQKLAKVVEKTLLEQCGDGSFYDCRRKLGFVISNPVFVHIKDDGALNLHPKDEYFDFVIRVVKDYNDWNTARVMGDSCFYDTMAQCNSRQNQEMMKRIKKEKNATLRHDEENVGARLQALRNVLNVTKTARVDPQLLALVLQLLDTSHCSTGLLGRLKKSKKQRNEWKYQLVQTMVYWFTVNPTKCEEILAGDPGNPPDSWALKCQAFVYSIKQKKAIMPLVRAMAENDSVKSTALAGSLRSDIEKTVIAAEEVILLNAKTAMDARGAALFLVQKRRTSLALLEFFSRSALLRKILSFIVGKMITFLLPEPAKLAIVGSISRSLKSGTQSGRPEGLMEKAVVDMMACGHEAVILCMTHRPNLARTAVRAFLNVAETVSKKKDKKAEAESSTSLIQLSNTVGSPSPSNSSPQDYGGDIDDFVEVELSPTEEQLTPLAQQFADYMEGHQANLFRGSWDEGDTHRSAFDKFRTLTGVPRTRKAYKKALVLCAWGLGLVTFALGIAAVTMFSPGHLFAYLGALSLSVGLAILVLIPLINYGILWSREYNRIAFMGGKELQRSPKKRVLKQERGYAPPDSRLSDLFDTQAALEHQAQVNPMFDGNEDET